MEYFRELSVAHTLVGVVAGSTGPGVLAKKTVVAQRVDTPERARAEWRRLVERKAECWLSCEYVKRLRPAPPRVVPHADFERRDRASDSAEDAAVFRDWLIEHDDPRAELALESALGDVRDWFLERPELKAEFDAFIGNGLSLSWRHGFLARQALLVPTQPPQPHSVEGVHRSAYEAAKAAGP